MCLCQASSSCLLLCNGRSGYINHIYQSHVFLKIRNSCYSDNHCCYFLVAIGKLIQLFFAALTDCSLPGSPSVHRISLARLLGVGCNFLLQDIFSTQGLNPISPTLAHRFFPTDPPGKPPATRKSLTIIK